MTRKARLFAGGLIVLLVLVVAADGTGSFCGPGNGEGEILFANDFLTNNSSSPVEVVSVVPNGADNLIVRDFSVGYRDRGDFLGTSPPDEAALSGNLIFDPKKTGAIQVILGLENPDRAGYASSLEVRYVSHSGRSEQSVSTIFELRVVPHRETCEGFDQPPPTAF